MSLPARARTLTNEELLNLYELSDAEERTQLAHELYTRLFRYMYGAGSHSAQQQLL